LNSSLRTLVLSLYMTTPFLEYHIVKQFMTAFQRNLFLQEVIIHEVGDNCYFPEEYMYELNHYCNRNIYIQTLLQPRQHNNDSQLYQPMVTPKLAYIPARIDLSSHMMSTKSIQNDILLAKQQSGMKSLNVFDVANDNEYMIEIPDKVWPNLLDRIVQSKSNSSNHIMYQLFYRLQNSKL
jgi:hypothetical protein